MTAPRDQLREIVERRRARRGPMPPDETQILLSALAVIAHERDATAVPWVIDLWCTRPASGLVLDELGSIAGTLKTWSSEKAMGAAIAETDSFARYEAAFDPKLLEQGEGIAFALAILEAFDFVAIRDRDGTLSNPVFPHPPVARALERPEWIALLASLRDHDDLGSIARRALKLVPKASIPRRSGAKPGALAKPRGDALSRYRAGEREAAWQSLCDLGPLGRDAREEACAVASEIMKVVRANTEVVVEVLERAGYPFVHEPLADPSVNRGLLAGLESEIGGTLPVSLEVFWEIVGAIDLCREETEDVCELDVDLDVFLIRDALMICSLKDASFSVREWKDDGRPTPHVDLDVSADELHKEWTSGGPPYAIRVPSLHADGRVLHEPRRLALVPYLRRSFEHCGFIGYELDRDAVPYRRLVDRVKHRLAPF